MVNNTIFKIKCIREFLAYNNCLTVSNWFTLGIEIILAVERSNFYEMAIFRYFENTGLNKVINKNN